MHRTGQALTRALEDGARITRTSSERKGEHGMATNGHAWSSEGKSGHALKLAKNRIFNDVKGSRSKQDDGPDEALR